MRELTQTNLDPGNCWQTAYACILDVEPATMPDQVSIETKDPYAYRVALLSYLRTHHGKAYVSVHGRPLVRAVKVEGLHVMCGHTVRTVNGKPTHAVVGLNGEQIWDPHPSHAGLTLVTELELLIPFPDEWLPSEKMPKGYGMEPCICPACPGGGT